MEERNYKDMSNSELKICKEKLENEFEATKAKIMESCEKLDKIEKEYMKADAELKIRRNAF